MRPSPGLTIGQVSAMLGVPVPTLRSWQRRYGLVAPERTHGGHRRYRPEDVAVLQALSAGVARGLAPRTVAQSLRAPRGDLGLPVELLGRVLARAAAEDQDGLCAVLDEAERALPLDEVVDRLLVPAVREVGLRWEVGTLDVGCEHLATTAVRRWLARRTGTSPVDGPPVLLAGAPGNEHTVALEAFGVLLERRGTAIRLCGGNTPVLSMVSTVRTTGAAAAVVTAQQVSRSRAAVEALRVLSGLDRVRLYYAGAAFDSARRRHGVPGTYLGTDLPAAADVVAQHVTGTPGSPRRSSGAPGR